jgi:hypothetical protein
MQLWQLDVMGSVLIKDPAAPGGVREAKLISGIDDHSRYSVIGKVVPRATARAVCSAFGTAMAEYGIPDEVLSDNGRQFTGRRRGLSAGPRDGVIRRHHCADLAQVVAGVGVQRRRAGHQAQHGGCDACADGNQHRASHRVTAGRCQIVCVQDQ